MSTPRRVVRLFAGLGIAVGVICGASSAEAAEYFMAPGGSDTNAGTSKSKPLQTFGAALGKLGPGDTLTLLDGTYTFGRNGAFRVSCGGGVRNGRKGARITVRANHQRKAWLKGDGSKGPVLISGCKYWDVRGLRVSSADMDGGSRKTFKVSHSHHIRLHGLLIHDVNRYQNSTGLQISASHHCLAEEIGIYYFHRHGMSAYKSDHITLRRAYIDGRGASDVSGGWGSHRCCTNGGDEAVSYYYTSNSIVENVITVDSEAISVISGFDTVLGNPGGRNNKVLGSISFRDLRSSFFQSRIKNSGSKSAKDIVVRNYLVVGTRAAPMYIRGPETFMLESATFYNTNVRPVHFQGAAGGKSVAGMRYFPGCEYWTCRNELRDVLFLNNTYPLITENNPSQPSNLQWFAEYSNAHDRDRPGRGFEVSEDVTDTSGQYRRSMETNPTEMGLGEGQCLVYVPENSSMSGAGEGGSDVGANLVYRYEDGNLTNKPLWDPQTGEFPCGARISGSPNDVAGESCFDIHERLNVNTNGCQLPYDSIRIDAEAKPNGGPAPLTVEFSATASNGTSPYSYEWTFGDGTAPSKKRAPTHTYQSPGEYTAELKVTDDEGESASTRLTVRVRDLKVLEADRTSGPITVDGKLDEGSWREAGAAEIVSNSGADKLSASAVWDDENLYVGLEIRDDEVTVSPGAPPWENDGAELFFDPEGDRGDSLESDDFKWIVLADGTRVFSRVTGGTWSSVSGVSGIDHAVEKTGAGYVIEVRLSWELSGLSSPTAGTELGLQVLNNDRDAEQLDRAVWDGDEPTASPRDWGLLRLVDGATGGGDGADIGRMDTASGGDAGLADAGEDSGGGGADAGADTVSSGGCGCSVDPNSNGSLPWGIFVGVLAAGLAGICRD